MNNKLSNMRDEFKQINKILDDHKILIDKFHVVAIPAPCPEPANESVLTFTKEKSSPQFKPGTPAMTKRLLNMVE